MQEKLEKVSLIQFPVKYGHLKTLFYGFFKKFDFCQSSGFLKGSSTVNESISNF